MAEENVTTEKDTQETFQSEVKNGTIVKNNSVEATDVQLVECPQEIQYVLVQTIDEGSFKYNKKRIYFLLLFLVSSSVNCIRS